MNPSRVLSAAVAAIAAAVLLFTVPPVLAQADETARSWNQPVEPFRIAGNLYYVGASDVTSYLLTTPEGHVLLDGGFAETAPQITRNIEKLGFKVADVKLLLNSQAHYDHAGGLALLKRLTGAKLLASAEDAGQLARGGKGDYKLGDQLPYEPVQADRIVRDGEAVTLGGLTLTARLTPGHTKGCTTWTMVLDDGGKKRNVVFVGGTSVLPETPLIDNPAYPKIAEDYARTFEVLKSLPCDVFLAAHGSFFSLQEKIARRGKPGETNPFVDSAGYKSYIEKAERDFREKLAAQRAAG